jgi:hypothetical protein
METLYGPARWLEIGPDGVGWSIWVENARLAANLVIVAASLSIARVLFRACGRATPVRPPRVLLRFASLAAICGIAHLAVLLSAVDSSPRVVPTLLKVFAAIFWVVTAFHTPTLVAHLATPPGLRPLADSPARALSLRKAERLVVTAQMLETMIRGETRPLEKAEVLRELREILADLETETCKT